MWSHSNGALAPPVHFSFLDDSSASKQQIQSICSEISKDSGAKQLPGLILVAIHYLILAAVLLVYCLIESKQRSFISGLILLAAPFLSFGPIVFAMIRDSPIDKINAYMDNQEMAFLDMLSKHQFSMTYLFISDARINGQRYGFFQRVILGRNFSGFVEFEEKTEKDNERESEENTDINNRAKENILDSQDGLLRAPIERNVIVPKPALYSMSLYGSSHIVHEKDALEAPSKKKE